ncbi:hypothetical protein ACTHQT_26735 [Cytobacillus praedii]
MKLNTLLHPAITAFSYQFTFTNRAFEMAFITIIATTTNLIRMIYVVINNR